MFSWNKYYSLRLKTRTKKSGLSASSTTVSKVISQLDLTKDASVLEIGAGAYPLKWFVTKFKQIKKYKTMDIDKQTKQDYYSLGEIKERFDLIICSNVIEHLDVLEAQRLLMKSYSLLNKEGKILIITDNSYFGLGRHFSDLSHKGIYDIENIGALLYAAGYYDFEAYRIAENIKNLVMRRIIDLVSPFKYAYGLDVFPGILVIGKKK